MIDPILTKELKDLTAKAHKGTLLLMLCRFFTIKIIPIDSLTQMNRLISERSRSIPSLKNVGRNGFISVRATNPVVRTSIEGDE